MSSGEVLISFKAIGVPRMALDQVATAKLGLSEQKSLVLAKGVKQNIGQNAIASLHGILSGLRILHLVLPRKENHVWTLLS